MKKNDVEQKQARCVSIACDFARSQGYDLNAYSVLSKNRVNDILIIIFQGESGLPGDHFSVQVDLFAEEVIRLIPGR